MMRTRSKQARGDAVECWRLRSGCMRGVRYRKEQTKSSRQINECARIPHSSDCTPYLNRLPTQSRRNGPGLCPRQVSGHRARPGGVRAERRRHEELAMHAEALDCLLSKRAMQERPRDGAPKLQGGFPQGSVRVGRSVVKCVGGVRSVAYTSRKSASVKLSYRSCGYLWKSLEMRPQPC